MNHQDLVVLAQNLFNEGSSKNDIAASLMAEGCAFSKVPKVLKDAELKFGKAKGDGWREKVVAAFAENKELTQAEFEDLIIDEVKDAEKYSKYFYDMMSKLANLVHEV